MILNLSNKLPCRSLGGMTMVVSPFPVYCFFFFPTPWKIRSNQIPFFLFFTGLSNCPLCSFSWSINVTPPLWTFSVVENDGPGFDTFPPWFLRPPRCSAQGDPPFNRKFSFPFLQIRFGDFFFCLLVFLPLPFHCEESVPGPVSFVFWPVRNTLTALSCPSSSPNVSCAGQFYDCGTVCCLSFFSCFPESKSVP